MKIGNHKVQSPPPKPPRRRYSDQLSISSIGTALSSKRVSEESQLQNNSRLNENSTKPNYLSLPASWTSNFSAEHSDISALPLLTNSLINNSKESKILDKTVVTHSNLISNYSVEGKTQFINEGSNYEEGYFKCPFGNSTSHSTEKCFRTTELLNTDKKCMASTCHHDYETFKSLHKNAHRRHHSDSVIFCADVSSRNNLVQSNLNKDSDFLSSYWKNFRKYNCKSCSSCKEKYLIMQEIQLLKEINHKLWKHVCFVQTCLENVRKQKNEDLVGNLSFSGLLSSIYYAQKAKDCAMEERLKIVLEERDAAFHELDDMIYVMAKSFDDIDSMVFEEKELAKSIKELCEIGYSLKPSVLLKCHHKLLAQMYHVKETKEDRFHDLKQAITERDKAVIKVTQLEEEIRNLQICYGLLHIDNKNWEITLFDVLRELLYQRDSVLSKIDKGVHLDNRSQVHRISHSFELNSLSSHDPLLSEMHKSQKFSHVQHFSDYKQHRSLDTCEETKNLKQKIFFLSKTLESEIIKREQAERKCLRLEKLIHLLRKKLNGQNIGVLV